MNSQKQAKFLTLKSQRIKNLPQPEFPSDIENAVNSITNDCNNTVMFASEEVVETINENNTISLMMVRNKCCLFGLHIIS